MSVCSMWGTFHIHLPFHGTTNPFIPFIDISMLCVFFWFLIGSPTYQAPEVLTEGVHSMASDLWSLGCVMYEMYTGEISTELLLL